MSSFQWFRDTCTVKVGDVIKDKAPIIGVECHTTIANTLDILNEQNITTLAVYGEVGHWLGDSNLVYGRKQYIGMVSILDILSFLMNASDDHINAKLQNPISNAVGSTNETRSVWTESADRPLFFCMEQFCRGTHHAFCVSEQFAEPKMIAQSDLVLYLLENEVSMPHITSVFNLPIASIASEASDYISGDDKLGTAVHRLVQHHALPVLGNDGQVISTLSATDMKGQLGAMVAVIAPMSVMDFILYRHSNVIPDAVALSPDTTVRDAAFSMIHRSIHRIWIQPLASGSLPGVISLTDIITAVFKAELPK